MNKEQKEAYIKNLKEKISAAKNADVEQLDTSINFDNEDIWSKSPEEVFPDSKELQKHFAEAKEYELNKRKNL